MKKLLIILLLLAALPIEAQVTGCVVDAETGAPLPYVSVRIDQERYTITNYEGDFSIEAQNEETLHFKCTGFREVNYLAGKLPKNIKMKPLDHTLKNVTVMSWESVLMKVSKRLQKDLNKHWSHSSRYFFRMTNQIRQTELVEALMEAHSATSLRDITFLSGRRGQMTRQGLSRPMIASMNFHHPLELGVQKIDYNEFWEQLTYPLVQKTSFYYLNYCYNISGQILTDSTGREIYEIEFKKKDDNKCALILTGTLYVDAKSLRPLRFDGQVEGAQVQVREDLRTQTAPISLAVHIDYSQRHGYTEVDNLSAQLKSGDLKNRMLMFNVDDMEIGKFKGQRTGENMLKSIDKAGNDENLWTREEFVVRTREEQQLARAEDEGLIMSLSGDDIDHMLNRLRMFGKRIPQEKVYVHMDNTSYFVGDTIWFAAYTRQTNTDMPSHVSGILYVELLNNDGYVMERKQIEMRDGRGHGNFVLGPDSYAGFYEIRAYTRWQLNWGVTERMHTRAMHGMFLNTDFEDRYFKDYDKLYSRVFPVYNKPLEPGVFAENMTTRTLRRFFKKDPDKAELTLKLYPEGGNLVQGVSSTIAFEAAWSDGREASGTLTVGNRNIPVENRGRGSFPYTPTDGKPLKVTFCDRDGLTVTDTIPRALPQGATLQMSQTDSLTWQMQLHLSSTLNPDSMAWTVMHEGRLQCTGRLTQRDTLIALPSDLPTGVCQATLFDHMGRVYADRLFFVMSDSIAQSNLSVSGQKEIYQPYEQIQLDLQSTLPSASLSLSVRDGALGDALFDNGTQLTEMLLSSEIKGFVPNPGWYFQRNDAQHRRALDLLMLTQGWRRFVWHDMAVRGSWDLSQPDEPAPVITGQVYDFDETPFYGMQAVHKSENFDFSWDDDYNLILNYFDPSYSYGDNVPGQGDDVYQDVNNPNEAPGESLPYTISPGSGEHRAVTSLFDYEHPYQVKGQLKSEVLVHAEMVSPDGQDRVTCEVMTRGGKFRIKLPKSYRDYLLFLSASDSSKWSAEERRNGYIWVQSMPNKSSLPEGHAHHFRVSPSELAVRVQFPYPRFVQPFNYYQRHIDTAFDPLSLASGLKADDGSILLSEVEVTKKRNVLHAIDESKPAFVIDAYDAYNQALDAGMRNAEPEAIVRTLLGSYGLEEAVAHEMRANMDGEEVRTSVATSSRIKVRYGFDQLRRHLNGVTLNPDSCYQFQNLRSISYRSDNTWGKYFFRVNQDKYVIYSDFCPRFYGSERYQASDLPETNVGIFLYPDDSSRVMYRDRRYIMPGISVAEDFYHPNYANRKPDEKPEDYRRTLYWNPDLQLDSQGCAHIHLWNSGKQTVIRVSAEGTTPDGRIVNQ